MADVILWRCQSVRCGSKNPDGRLVFDFDLPPSSPPVCPQCGADGRVLKTVVVRRKVLHYDPPHEHWDGRGRNQAACDPAIKWEGSEYVGFTGDPGAATCAACRKTPEWRKAALEQHLVEPWELEPENEKTPDESPGPR